MSDSLPKTLTLNNGVAIPRLGLGVYQSDAGPETVNAVKWALADGYRHVDTAALYGNEADVGRALRESGVPRSDVFIVTKLWNGDHGYDAARRAFERSLANLQTETIDLYLIHFPVAKLRKESWRALEAIYKDGQARAIGVSNYTMRHLDELLGHAEVVPAVNQVEFSPFLFQSELLAYTKLHGIALEAYSPLTQGERLGHPTIVAMAEKYGKTPAQIMIRWVLQHDMIVIPKSVKQARIHENGDVFDFAIGHDDMGQLDALNEDLRVCWDPSDAP